MSSENKASSNQLSSPIQDILPSEDRTARRDRISWSLGLKDENIVQMDSRNTIIIVEVVGWDFKEGRAQWIKKLAPISIKKLKLNNSKVKEKAGIFPSPYQARNKTAHQIIRPRISEVGKLVTMRNNLLTKVKRLFPWNRSKAIAWRNLEFLIFRIEVVIPIRRRQWIRKICRSRITYSSHKMVAERDRL